MKIIADLHTHTIASIHAYSSLQENIQQATQMDMKYLGITDHAPGMTGTTHVNYFENMKVWKPEILGVRVFRGVECNICDELGTLDLPNQYIDQMDYVIVSIHRPIFPSGLGAERNTNAVVKAIQHSKVRIIGHPDNGQYPFDYEKLVNEAKQNHVALELNNSSLTSYSARINTRENALKYLALCKATGTYIAVNSDSHIFYDVANFSLALELLHSINFPEELVVNSSKERLEAFLSIKL